jgi:hypothetical protein
MKKYQRATKNELDTFLIRSNMVKTQPDLFNDICDMDGNTVEAKSLPGRMNLQGPV